MDSGFIYKIISPSGKAYIGQVVEFLTNGDKKGVEGRWKQHINSSKTDKGCVYLNRAINKYGYDTFKIIILMKCKKKVLNLFEELFIKTHNTLAPNGYNLQSGGSNTKHSIETCTKRSESMKKLLEDPEKRKIWSNAKLGKVQEVKRKCKNSKNQNLPKYIMYKKNGKYEGYYVEHPKLGNKSFSKSKYTLEENLQLAIDYINNSNV